MNRISEYQRASTNSKWSLSSLGALPTKNKLVLAGSALAMFALGSFFLVYYPLETMIVSLFIGSVFVLDRK
jgi:hypothetical protein